MSLYGVVYYKREGYLPGASRAPTNAQMIDPDKDAFSTAPHDDEYMAVHNTDHDEIHVPSHASDYDPPTYAGPGSSVGGSVYAPPTVSDDMGYTGYMGAQGRQSPQVGDNGRVHFPNARYNEV